MAATSSRWRATCTKAWAGEGRANGGEGLALMTEFCANAISSHGDGSETLAATPMVLRRNAHISFFNNRRGHCLHGAGAKQMAVSFRAVDYVTRPGLRREWRGSTGACPSL